MKDERLQAIRYSYAFEVTEKFPPVPLLKDHLAYSKNLAVKLRMEGNTKEATVCHLLFIYAVLVLFFVVLKI